VGGGTLDIQTFSDTVGAVTLTSGSITGTSGILTGSSYDMRSGNASAILGGSGALTKSTAGTVILTGANTYTGLTTISAGTLQLGDGTSGNDGTIANTSGLVNNGALVFNSFGSSTASYAISGLGSVTKTGAGTQVLGATNSYTGKTTVQNGTLSFSVGNASATANQQLGANAALDLGLASISSGRLLYTGGAGTLAKNINALGHGTDTIENGGSGLLALTGTLTKNGTTLTLKGGSNGITVSGTGTIAGSSANSDLIVDGGIVNLETANTYNGPTFIINGATLNATATNALPTANGRSAIRMDESGSGSSTLAMTVSQSIASLDGASNSAVNLNATTLTIGTSSGSSTFAGVISGTGGLTKDNASTLILTGTNTYTGATTINNGILELSGSGSINGSDVTVNGGSFINNSSVAYTGTLTLNNASLGGGTIDGDITYSGGGTVSGSSSVTGSVGSSSGSFSVESGANLTVGTSLNVSGTAELVLASTASVIGSINYSSSANSTIEGVIAGTDKTLTLNNSSAVLTLTGNNTYTGATTIDAGKLVVNGNISSSSLTSVASGATIGGSGTVGDLTVSSGGFINPGNSPGILNVSGDYTQAGLYTAEITGLTAGTEHDQINVTGSVDITGGSLTALFTAGTYAANDLIFILLNDGVDAITGTYSGFAQGATVIEYDGFDWKISYTANSTTNSFTGGNDIALMAIPEPKAALLGGLGLLLLLRRRR
jgi:fibronectin-binding autotransporter adhesin